MERDPCENATIKANFAETEELMQEDVTSIDGNCEDDDQTQSLRVEPQVD